MVPATRAHAAQLASTLREEDLAEVLALGYPSGAAAVLESFATSSVAYALLFDGEVAALMGVGQVLPRPTTGDSVACVWALTGRPVWRHRKAFVRASRPVLELLLQHCGILWNWVDARYTGALRWVKWMGFSVGPARELVAGGRPFHPISIQRT